MTERRWSFLFNVVFFPCKFFYILTPKRPLTYFYIESLFSQNIWQMKLTRRLLYNTKKLLILIFYKENEKIRRDFHLTDDVLILLVLEECPYCTLTNKNIKYEYLSYFMFIILCLSHVLSFENIPIFSLSSYFFLPPIFFLPSLFAVLLQTPPQTLSLLLPAAFTRRRVCFF